MTPKNIDKIAPLCARGFNNTPILDEDASCSICREHLTDNQMYRKLPCNHYFHAHCIDMWLLTIYRIECPNCKTKFELH